MSFESSFYISLDGLVSEDGPTWVQIAKTGVKIPNTSLTMGPELFTHWEKTWNAMGRPGEVTALHPSKRARPVKYGGLGQTVPLEDFRSFGSWLEVRHDAEGFYVLVDWTEEGRKRVRSKEFRGASLEMPHEIRTSEGVFKNALTGFTLTNNPFVSGMQPVAADNVAPPEPEEVIVSDILAKFAAKLGVEGVDEDTLITALDSKIEAAEAPAPPADDAELRAELSTLRREVVTLQGNEARRSAEDLYDTLLEAGKVVPAQRENVLKMAVTDLEGTRSFFESAPTVIALDDAQGSPTRGRASHGGLGSGSGQSRGSEPIEVALDASDKISAGAKKRIADNPELTFEQAVDLELRANPTLESALTADIQ